MFLISPGCRELQSQILEGSEQASCIARLIGSEGHIEATSTTCQEERMRFRSGWLLLLVAGALLDRACDPRDVLWDTHAQAFPG